jgi:hypothetical protein
MFNLTEPQIKEITRVVALESYARGMKHSAGLVRMLAGYQLDSHAVLMAAAEALERSAQDIIDDRLPAEGQPY